MLTSRWRHARTIVLVLLLALQFSPVLTFAQDAGTPEAGSPEQELVIDPEVTTETETAETPAPADPLASSGTPEPTSVVSTETSTAAPTVEVIPSGFELADIGPPGANPTVQFSTLEGFVGQEITYTVTDFPANTLLFVVHEADGGPQLLMVNVETDGSGYGQGTFEIPAVRGETNHTFRISTGVVIHPDGTWDEHFSLSPGPFFVRMQLTVSATRVAPGDQISATLTGVPMDTVAADIRFGKGPTYAILDFIMINNNGYVSFGVTIPDFAASGENTLSVAGASVKIDVFRQVAPLVTLSTERTTVNANVSFSLVGFAKSRPLTVTWKRPGGSTLIVLTTATDRFGEATGTFKVPATEGGNGNRIIFTASSVTRTLDFDVAPRIKIIPAQGERGDLVEVSLRGFTKNEPIRLRWKIGSSFVLISTVTVSNTGSGNYVIQVPANASLGANSIRADGTIWRQQTNAFVVSG